ncbi:MAG: prepilin-type N-terminal cleavage/methylation domain-containing protein [bacterium]|nr:prepilin-type N-terminal cleavage/methylation domain-containing protein [bacterium]
MKLFKNKKNNSGFTLIEALVLVFIFSIITITFYQVISVGTRYIIFSKNRLVAISLANERMEIARNLQYDDVGIQDGACVGNIPQDEEIIENGKTFHVHTLATYIDDPFDGTLGGSPNDTAYKDYKIVKVTVSWNNGNADAGSVFLLSRFVPPGLEEATLGDGILLIKIFSDQAGAGVPQATVKITNADLGFSENRQTDGSGDVMLVGIEESFQRYKIEVSKTGYETVVTKLPYPDTDYNPTDTHASVVAGEINNISIILNKLADLKISTQDYFGDSIADIDFKLKGGRKIGTDEVYPYTPFYNLDVSDKTDSEGKKEYDAVSPGQYSLVLSDSETDYRIIGTDPATPFLLLSEQDLDLKVKLAAKNETSILATIKKSDSDSLFSGAKVELSNSSGYSEEITTDDNGTAFFPLTNETPFVAGTYTLKITGEGYDDYLEDIEIVENQLSEKDISMIYNL